MGLQLFLCYLNWMHAKSRVLVVHRAYRYKGGEDIFIERVLTPSLKDLGVEHSILVLPALGLIKDIFEFVFMKWGFEKLRPSYRRVLGEVESFQPTHVVFNNFIPTISLALPAALKERGIKVYAWVHNGRLSCANGLFFNGKETCHRCFEVGSRAAFKFNCLQNKLQSALYAWVYRNRRVPRTLAPAIDRFIAVSDYSADAARSVLQVLGETGHQVEVACGVAPAAVDTLVAGTGVPGVTAPFYLFMGRLSYEKGADRFAKLAAKHPEKRFVMCGVGPQMAALQATKPANLIFLGQVGENEKPWLYENAEALIIPSRVGENAPMVILESEAYGTPIVFERGGGAEELVKELARPGCAFEDFRGQHFERHPLGHERKQGQQKLKAEFHQKLRDLFS